MTSHRIIGSEAIDQPGRRLVHFSHAHGAMRMLPQRRGQVLPLLLAFGAGVAVAVAALILLAGQ